MLRAVGIVQYFIALGRAELGMPSAWQGPHVGHTHRVSAQLTPGLTCRLSVMQKRDPEDAMDSSQGGSYAADLLC